MCVYTGRRASATPKITGVTILRKKKSQTSRRQNGDVMEFDYLRPQKY